jgi:2-C-methyl-D-erythritol 4-phosphate cytidylyltransferase
MYTAAVIVAGGLGVRMGNALPKQFLPLGGTPILMRTLEQFITCSRIDEIVVAVPMENITETKRLTAALASGKPVRVVPGGAERQDSVFRGLSALRPECGIVVIHDAVRPFITAPLIAECVETAERFGAATVACPIKETVKAVEDGMVVKTLDRSKLWIAQTPQAFRAEIILRAHEQARLDRFLGTDDCMLVERLGQPVHVIEGMDENIKITTPVDLAIAGVILTLYERGGNGC